MDSRYNWVYILSLNKNRFYAGTTTDLARRMQSHSERKNYITKQYEVIKLEWILSNIEGKEIAGQFRSILNSMLNHKLRGVIYGYRYSIRELALLSGESTDWLYTNSCRLNTTLLSKRDEMRKFEEYLMNKFKQ
jgi:GIY-YIG catalytic domain